MFGMRSVPFSARAGAWRPGSAAALALWALLSLVSGATQALCLDLGGDCSTAVALASCHGRSGENGSTPDCGSCVDILVPDDASAHHSRPDHDSVSIAAAPYPLIAANGHLDHAADTAATFGTVFGRRSPLCPSPRTTVLLI